MNNMRLKKSALSLAMALAVISSVSAPAFAHPGRTDSSGGHYDRSTGEYHYHNGGSSSGSGSSGSSSRSTSSSSGSSSGSKSGSSSGSKSGSSSSSSRKAKWDGDKYWNGSKYVTGFCTIDGKKYCFDSSGKLCKNKWVENSSGERFYIGSDGTVCTGWKSVDGHKYHLSDDGSMSTGWCKVDGKSYFLGNDGIARTGFRSIDGKVYCFDKNGAMCTGWQKIDGSTYYFKSSGERVSGKVKIDGKVYSFDENGRLQNSASTASAAAASAGQTSALQWGMTMDEVIEARQLDKYVIDEDVILATDKVISDCYFFYEDSLCGYGQWTAYSKSSLKSFKKSLEDDGWKNAGSDYEDGISYVYYTKDGHLTVLFHDDEALIKVRYADDFLNL